VLDTAPAPARTVRAFVFAIFAVVGLLALRATSDGPAPALLMTGASVGLIAIAARPLMARERSLPMVLGWLLAIQLLLHVTFLFVSTGRLMHAGSTGLFCSPSSGAGSVSCAPTDRGGVTLLTIQLLSAAIAALWLRGLDRTVWMLARTVSRNLRGVIDGWLPRLLGAVLAVVHPAVAPVQIQHAEVEQLHDVDVVHSHGRRGPPPTRVRDAIRSAPRLSLRAATS
jgi:hypothetical protein